MSFLVSSNSSKKMNENESTWGIIIRKSNFFVRFLEELRIPKSPFEINWPLAPLKIPLLEKLSAF